MKLCIVNFHDTWGGAERVALEVAEALQHIYDVELITSAAGQFSERAVGLKIHSLFEQSCDFSSSIKKLQNVIRFGIRLRKHVRQTDFNVVYLNNQVAIFMSIFLIGLDCQVIGHDHTFQRAWYRRLLYNITVSIFLDKIIFVSNALRERNIIGNCKKSVVVYNGFDFNTFPKKTGLKETVLVMPSMMRKWKGHNVLIEALLLLRKQGRLITCYMIGAPSTSDEKRYFAKLQARIRECKLEQQVIFTGYITNVIEFIASRSSVMVQPSTQADPLPTTLIEGCFLGIPTIGSDIGGIPEIIDNGKNGYLFTPSNAESLMNQILKVLDQSPEERRAMSLLARQKFIEKFSSQSFKRRIIEEINKC